MSPAAEPGAAPMTIVKVNINTEEPTRQNELSAENDNKPNDPDEYDDDPENIMMFPQELPTGNA